MNHHLHSAYPAQQPSSRGHRPERRCPRLAIDLNSSYTLSKRKRVVSGNENTHSVSRGSRNGLNAFKRRRPSLQLEDSSDEGTGTAMEVNTRMRCSDSERSSDGDASDWDSCKFSFFSYWMLF
jgi:hypothetical protein